MPVLSGSTLLGIISPKDIARCLYLAHGGDEQSAKFSYVSTVMPRKGMPLGTQLRMPLEQQYQAHTLRSAVCNLPHPHKGTLGEDAFLLGPHMCGVADGVGSWWEAEVDPAVYAQAMMHLCRNSCMEQKEEVELMPTRVLEEAWHRLQDAHIVGSCTVCLVSLHPFKSELLAANVGDSGFLILRNPSHGKSAPSEPRRSIGTLDAFGAAESSNAHKVAFRSPQQLRAFNAPYQLGRAPDSPTDKPDDRFETPHDASLVRVPIRTGDIIVMATDGLFDNMPETEVLEVVEAHADGTEEEMARALAMRAQELSLDSDVDSPFALLAKDNDIMWGGGRPDDITVIVSRVVDTVESDEIPAFTAFTGPDSPPDSLFPPKPPPPVHKIEPMEASWD